MTTPMGHIDSCACPDCASRTSQMSPAALMGVAEVQPQPQVDHRARRARSAVVRQLAVNVLMTPQPGGPEVGELDERTLADRQLADVQRGGMSVMVRDILAMASDMVMRAVRELPDDKIEEFATIVRALHDKLSGKGRLG